MTTVTTMNTDSVTISSVGSCLQKLMKIQQKRFPRNMYMG